MPEKISKEQANYRSSRNRERDCGICNMFRAPKKNRRRKTGELDPYDGSCTLVKGAIFEDDVCDYWEKL